MEDDSGNCEGGLHFEEEDTTHPEQIPLLALRQVDDEGYVCGEVWFSPAQLPELIRALEEQLALNYSGSAALGWARWPPAELASPRPAGVIAPA